MAVINGTYYKDNTPARVIELLEWSRTKGIRIRVYYGDQDTGRDWGDVYGVTGVVGRSMGPMKIPLLIHNRRSLGGAALLDDCIIRIRYANKKQGGDLYCHPKYHTKPELTDQIF